MVEYGQICDYFALAMCIAKFCDYGTSNNWNTFEHQGHT